MRVCAVNGISQGGAGCVPHRENIGSHSGPDIPTPDEIRKIIHATTGKRRPLLLTAIFTGLRGSELRGLRWQDVDLNKGELHVRQRVRSFSRLAAFSRVTS